MKKLFDNSKQFCLWAGCFLMLCLLAIMPQRVVAQQSLSPGTTPNIVPMGDSLVCTFELNGASAIAGTVTKVSVPTGYEILASTPNQVAGTMAADSKSVILNTPVPTTGVTYKVYIKPLCNADIAGNNPLMVITYALYSSLANANAGTATGRLKTATAPFSNIYNPILNVTYPAGQNTSLGSTVDRVFSVTQTAALSHVNNFQITANVTDKTGFETTRIRISKNGISGWIDITATALDAAQAGKYVYTIKKANITALGGYTGNHLNSGDKIYIEERVVLRKCDAGSVNYTVAIGDGATFCSPIASAAGNVNLGVSTPAFSNDLVNGGVIWPQSPSIDGQWRTRIVNSSTDPLAVMKDLYLTFGFGSQYMMKKAYIVDASGNIIPGSGGDTIFLQMTAGTGTRTIYFNNLTNTANAAIYNSIGLINADGDGVYNDFNISANFYIQIAFNIVVPTGCSANYIPGVGTTGWGYYKWCDSYVQFGRAYQGGGPSFWISGLSSAEIRNVSINPSIVQVGDQATLNFLKYEATGSFLDALHGADANATSTYYTYFTLPIGLDYDNTRPIVIRTPGGVVYPITPQNIYGGNITWASGLVSIEQVTVAPSTPMRIKVRVLPNLDEGTQWEIPVVANSILNSAGQFSTESSFDYGNLNDFRCFGRLAANAIYIKAGLCSEIELMNFNVDRTTMGYSNISKSALIAPSQANTKVIYPYDNVTLTTNMKVRGNIDISGAKVITATASYFCENLAIGSAYLVPQPGMTNPATLILYRSGSPYYINIPAADLKQPAAFDNNTVPPAPAANYRYTQYLETDIAKAIRTLGASFNTLQTGDSIVLMMYARSTASLPTINDYASRPVMMTLYNGANPRSASPTNIICNPIIDDDVKIVMYYFSDCLTDNGDSWSSWNEINESTSNDLYYGFNKYLGGYNLLTNGEYRPNIDTFSNITFVYNGLIQVNSVYLGLWNGSSGNNSGFGNEVARTLATSEYTVTYADGKTTVTVDPLKDHMFTGVTSTSWVGYYMAVRWESINPGAGNILNTGKTVSFTATEFPTSENPQPRTFNNKVIGTDHNNAVVNYYTINLNSTSPIQSPKTNIVEWPFAIENTSAWVNTNATLPNSWVSFESTQGIIPYQLIDVTAGNTVIADISTTGFIPYTDAAGNTHYWVQLGNVTANPSHSYRILCTYSSCTGQPTMTVRAAMSKLAYPQDPYSSFAQDPYYSPQMPFHTTSTIQLRYNPPVNDFSGTLVHRPSPTGSNDPVTNTPVIAGKNRFCDTVGFRATFYNGTDAIMYNLKVEIPLPPNSGYTWSSHPNYHCGAVRVKYGSGAWEAPKSAQMQGGNLVIILDDTFDPAKTAAPYNGSNNSDEVYVDFTIHIGCGFETRTQLRANFSSESGCGNLTTKGYASGQILVNGLAVPPVYAFDNLNLVQTPYSGTAGNDGSMTLTGAFRSINTTEDDMKAIIELPANLMLDGHNSGSQLTFTQEGTQLSADLPLAGLPGGTTSNFSINLRPINPATWTADTFYIYFYVGKITGLTCLGTPCSLMEISEFKDSTKLNMEKIKVKFDDEITANSHYNDPNTERVQIEYALINYGTLDAARLTVDLVYFDGIDYIPVDGIIGGGRVVNGINVEDTVPLTINVNVSYMQDVCRMFLMLRKWTDEPGAMNAFLADSAAIVVPVPIYHLQPGPDPICQLSGTQMIGEPAIHDYNYTWTPSTHLNRGTISPSAFSFDYENYPQWNDTTLKYAISVIRPNGCVSIDTLPIEIKGMPYVQDLTDSTICSGSNYRIDFADEHNSLGTTTFQWTVSNGPSVSMPASGTTPYINVSQVRNTGTQPTVLQVQAMPKKGGCDGVTKTYFITVNPKPRTNYISDQSYCAGQIVPAQTVSGDNSAALYHWKFAADGSDNLFSPTTEGINLIPNLIAQNSTNSNRTGNYYAYAAYENAGKTCYSDTIEFDITVEPMPSVSTVGDRLLCSGDNLTVNFSGNSAGSFIWQKVSGNNIPNLATNGTGNISLNNIQNTGSSPIQALYTVTPVSTSGRCMGSSDNFTIAIYPTPVISGLKSFTQCSGERFSYTLSSVVNGVGFTWTRRANANINGADGGHNGSGAIIDEALTNSSTSAVIVTYIIEMTANGCTAKDSLKVTVNPMPKLTSSLTPSDICSGKNFTYDAAYTPTTATLAWERLDNASILQPGTTGTADPITHQLTNISTAAATVTYIYTLSKDGCTNEQRVRVVVQPEPLLTSSLDPVTICSGGTFNYTATSAVRNTEFKWSRAAIVGNAAKTNIAGRQISEVLTNNTLIPAVAKYVITTTYETCTSVDTIYVTINPPVTLSTLPTNAAICSEGYYSYTIPSNLDNAANYTWRRQAHSNILQGASSGTSREIYEQLTLRNTTSAVDVTYKVRAEANGCMSTEGTFTVKVHPKPTISVTTPTPLQMAIGNTRQVTVATNGTIDSWSSSNTAVATVTSTSATTQTVTAVAQGIAEITVTTKNTTTGCINTTTFVVNVDAQHTATLRLASNALSEVCLGGSTELEVVINGGTPPFTVTYTTNGANPTVINNVGSSNHRITVTPSITTTPGVQTTTVYALSAVSETNGAITVLPSSSVTITRNPVATISTTLNDVTVCEGVATSTINYTASPASPIIWQWENSNPAIGLGMSGTSASIPAFIAANGQGQQVSGTVTVTPYYKTTQNTCPGTAKTFTIRVNPKPDFTVIAPDAICSGQTVTFTEANHITNKVPSGAGTVITFYNNITCGTANVVTTVTPPTTTTYFARAIATACTSAVKEIIVPVKPLPVLTSAKTASVCSGDLFTYEATGDLSGISYSWTRAAVTGISNPAVTTGAGATIRETLINTTTAPINVVYKFTLSAAGCTASVVNVTVTVNPTPKLNNIPSDAARNICSGATFAWTPATATAGANIAWDRLDNSQIAEPGINNQSGAISEVLTNMGTVLATVTYEVTLTANGCENTQLVRVIVQPKPELNSNLDPVAICHGATFTYNPTSAVRNATITWSRAAAGTNPAKTDVTTLPISETLNNTGTGDLTATYVIKSVVPYGSGNCTVTENLLVTIHPQVTVTSAATASICSESYLDYTITSTPTNANTNYTWRRQVNGDILQGASSGAGNPVYEQLTLRNNVTIDKVAKYYLRAELNGCVSAEKLLDVTVKVKPTIQIVTATPLQMAVNNIETVTATTNGTITSWTSSNTAVATVASINATSAKVTAVGQGIAEITVTTTGNGCTNSTTFIVNVEAPHTAVLTLASNALSEICSEGTTTLEVAINGGRPPFTVYYSRRTGAGAYTQQPILTNVGSSNHRFAITLPANTGNAAQDYTFKLDSVKEAGPQSVTPIASTVTITVNPKLTVSNTFASPYTYCEGAIVSGLPTLTSNAAVAANVIWQWENSNPAIGLGISGTTASIANFIAANGQGVPISGTITAMPYYRGSQSTCPGTSKSYTITINPKPDFTVVNPAAICKGGSVDLPTNKATYVQNVIPSGSTIRFYTDRACNSEITTALTPAVTTTYFVRVTSVSPALCNSAVKEITVEVKPLPVLTSATAATVCSGELFTYEAMSDLSGVSYAWTRAAVTGITNPAVTNGAGSIIRETLINETGAPITVKYDFVLTAAGCDAAAVTVNVIVNPSPRLKTADIPSAADRNICSGASFAWTPTSNVTGASILWSRLDNSQIAEPGNNDDGAISEVLTNMASVPVTVTYEFTLSNLGCEHSELMRVIVQPSPVLNSSLDPVELCHGATFNYRPTSAVRNATITWSRPAIEGSAAVTNSTTLPINETLINTTTSDVTVVYTIKSVVLDGNNDPCTVTENLSVTVHPELTITNDPLTDAICSEEYFDLTIASNLSNNVNYSWRRQANAHILQGASSGISNDIYEQLTIRNSTTPVTVSYFLRAEANGCMSAQKEFKVTVNPKPTVQIVTATPLQLAVHNIDTVIAAPTGGTITGWTSSNDNVATVTMLTDENQARIVATGQGIAEITVVATNSITGCTGEVTFIVNVEAEHTAVLTLASNAMSEICSDGATTLEVTINGGRPPFTVYYSRKEGSGAYVSQTPLTNVGSSNHRFVVGPLSNTGTGTLKYTYQLDSVKEAGPQAVTPIPSTVEITVNPVAKITTDLATNSPYTYCEGTITNLPTPVPAFVSSSSPVIWQWENDNPAIGLGMSGTTSIIAPFMATNGQGVEISANVTVTPYYRGLQVTCVGEPKTFVIKVNPKPDFTVVNPDPICVNEKIKLNDGVTDYVQNIVPSSSTVGFYSDRACTINIGATELQPPVTTTYFVMLTSASPALCKSDRKEITVEVKPRPNLTGANAVTVCSGEPFSYEATSDLLGVNYTWERIAATGINSGAGATGFGSTIRETLINATGTAITVKYAITMTAAGCDKTDTVKVTVNPMPKLNNAPVSPAICSETKYVYDQPASDVLSATINWMRIDNSQIAEPGSNGTNVKIDETLTNTGVTPVTVTYEFTLSNAGCQRSELVRVVVNPKPTLTSSLYAGAICSGSGFNYTARSATRNVNFTWTRQANAAITPAPTADVPGANINEILTNISPDPVTVYYDITLTTTTTPACTYTETVEVTVNPMPKLDPGTLNAGAICSGNAFIFEMESATQNTSYSWMRLSNPKIAEAPSFGNSMMISEVLTNRGDAPTTVNYKVFTEANGCRNSGDTVTVIVNNLPKIVITSPTPINLTVNNTREVEITIPADCEVDWSTANTNVATITEDASDETKATVTGVAQGLTDGIIIVTNTITGCENSVVFTINVEAEQMAQLQVPTGYVPQVCNGDSTMLEISMSGGDAPFSFQYTDGTWTYFDTAYQGNHRFVIHPETNPTGNSAVTTIYTLTSVVDATGQSLSIVGQPIRVTTNPVATVSNVALLGDTICEGELERIPKFETAVTPANRVSYHWENDNPTIGLVISGAGHIPVFLATNGYGDTISGNVTVYPIYNDLISCPGTESSFRIMVEPKPDFVVIDPDAICDGTTFNLTDSTDNMIQGVTPAGCTIEYFTERTCINPVTTVTPERTTTYYVKLTSPFGCESMVKELVISVNPVPKVDSVLDQMICNLDGINIAFTGNLSGTLYYWSKSGTINPNIVGLPSSGTGILSATHLRNSTTDLQEQEITVIPELTGGRGNITCIGDPITFKIQVNPTPIINTPAVLNPICSGSSVIHTPLTLTANTTIYWEREEHALIEEISTNGVIEDPALDEINEVLTNNSHTIANVRYNLILETNGCSNDQHISVKVNPTPYLSSTLNPEAICSGGDFSYHIESAVKGATFEWARVPNAAIDEPDDSGTGAMIYETLTNNTAAPVPVEYVIMTTANGCSYTETVTVYVGPKLGLSSTLTPPDICSEEYFIYTATSDVNGVHYTWNRTFNRNIDPPLNDGINAFIAERLVNLSDTAENISYYITQTTNEGCQLTEQITFKVHPLPAITVSEPSVTIAQGATRDITVTDAYQANGSVVSSDPAVTATYDGATGKITLEGAAIGYSEVTYTTYDNNPHSCYNSLVIPVIVTPAPLGTLEAMGVTNVCSEDSTELQITDIIYGKAPWTVEINYTGSAVPNVEVTINNVMELPYILTVHLPANNTQTAFVKTWSIVKITDSEGSERTSHIGRIPITVAPVPTVDAVADQEICNGSYSAPVYFGGAATNFRWRIDKNVGLPLFGEGDMPSAILTHGDATAVNALVKVTPIYTVGTTTCVGDTGTFTITVNPMPKVNPIADITHCHNTTVNVTPAGAATTKFVCTTLTDIGMAASVTVTAGNSLTFTAINTTNMPITATVTILPVYESGTQECYGETTTFDITVNPIPTINPTLDMTFCEEYSVNAITFTGNVPGAVYSWQHIAGDAITGVSTSGINQIPPFIAYNLADTILTSTFEVVASYMNNGITCSLYKDTFDINIYPKPSIEPILNYEYCAQVLADSIPFAGNNDALNIYDWRIVTGPNIGLPTTYGSSTGIAEFTTVNTNSYMRNTLFEVTPRINGTACAGNSINFSITVNPVALLSSALHNDTLCAGEYFTYNATSTSNNVFFRWKRPAIGGMDSIKDQGVYIHERLYNNTDAPIEVPYIITLTYEGCDNEDTTFVAVKPTPAILLDSAYYHACQGDVIVDLTYTIDRQNLPLTYSIIFDDEARKAGFANTIGINQVITQGIITVTVPSPVASGRYMGTLFIESYGCPAKESYPFVILVAPATVITKEPEAEIMMCEGFGTLHISIEAIGEAVTYQWYHNGVAISGANSSEYILDIPSGDDFGEYFVIATGVCGSDTSAIARVVPNAASIYMMGSDMLFVSGLDSMGTNLQFNSYQWSKLNESTGKFLPISDGSNSQYYYDESGINGTYMVEITYKDGTKFKSCAFSFTPPPPAKLLKIYPNPVVYNETFYIELGDDVKPEDWSRTTIEVMSSKGQLLQKIVPSAQITDIRMSMPAAVYTIRLIKANGEVSIHKLIVN